LLKILNLKRLTGDTGVPGLNRDVAYKENIILPDLPTQQKIADLLSVYDDLIENNERRIKILEETAQRLYTEWFVKFNLPAEVLTKAGFPDGKLKMIDSGTEYGIIPEGWEITKLGNKIKIRKGKNITKGTITHGVVPVIAGGLNAAYYHNKVNTKWPVVTISASGANAGFVNLHYEDVWASDCSYIDSNVTRNVYFHYLYLKNKNKEIKNLQRGAAQPHVYPKDLMTLSIIDYPEALIDNFQREVNKLFVLIGNVKNKNRVLTKIRDLLISQIITGKRALK
jgi:Restriction endonuclease S subunits